MTRTRPLLRVTDLTIRAIPICTAPWRCPITQYLLNHRSYLTAVRHIWGDLFLSFEWNHLMTKWTTGESFAGDNFMISTWYNF